MYAHERKGMRCQDMRTERHEKKKEQKVCAGEDIKRETN